MKTLRASFAAAILCSGAAALSGCHSETTGANGVPIPPPSAAPSAQAQIQEIENNPHIPAAQKADLESHISSSSGAAANPASP